MSKEQIVSIVIAIVVFLQAILTGASVTAALVQVMLVVGIARLLNRANILPTLTANEDTVVRDFALLCLFVLGVITLINWFSGALAWLITYFAISATTVAFIEAGIIAIAYAYSSTSEEAFA